MSHKVERYLEINEVLLKEFEEAIEAERLLEEGIVEVSPFHRAACAWLNTSMISAVKRSACRRRELNTWFVTNQESLITQQRMHALVANELASLSGVAHLERLPMDGVEPVGWAEVKRRIEKMDQQKAARQKLLPFASPRRWRVR